MKRFFSYLLTYILITFLAVVCIGCVYFIFNGGDLSTNTDGTTAVIRSASEPTVVSEIKRGTLKEVYSVATMQVITVEYTYNGRTYKGEKEVYYDRTEYKSEPNISSMRGNKKYNVDGTTTIYVYKDEPTVFDMADVYEFGGVKLTSILKFGVPLYLAMLVVFTWTIVQKEKEIKKQKILAKLNY